MTPAGADDVSALLRAWGEGDREAAERIVPLLYPELQDKLTGLSVRVPVLNA